jgi:hypothetical protein
MSVEALAAVFKHSESRGGARLVMIGIANRADEHGIGWPDVADLMLASRMERSSVKAGLKKLREAGELEPVDDHENIGGRGRSTLYRISLPGLDGEYTDEARSRRDGWVAWRAGGGKKASKKRVRNPDPKSDKGSGSPPVKGPVDDVKGPVDEGPYIEEPSVEPSREPSPMSDASGADVDRLCRLLAAKSNARSESTKHKVTPSGLDAMDKLMRIDGRSPEQIEFVINWLDEPGNFWGTVVFGAPKLREKFDQLVARIKADRGSPRGNRRSNREDLARRAEEARKRAGR